MGSSGIKRRKPKRRLRRLKAWHPNGDSDVPPHIMWPAAGAGFEASPWSPAGRAQASWLFTRGILRRGGGRRGSTIRVFAWLLFAMWCFFLIWAVVSLVR